MERNERILALRRQGATLESIGREFGITRERVRQIVKRAAPAFTNDIAVTIRLGPMPRCEICGAVRGRDASRKTCGRVACRAEYKRLHPPPLTDFQKRVGVQITTLRSEGRTWEEIGTRVWPGSKAAGLAARAHRYGRLYEKKMGLDSLVST